MYKAQGPVVCTALFADCVPSGGPGGPGKAGNEGQRRRGAPTFFTRNNGNPMSATQSWNWEHPKQSCGTSVA